MKLVDILSEIIVKDKEMFNRGANQFVYPSHNNPDILYKVGHEGKLEHWVTLFKSHPDLFPKVYGDIKTGTFPVKGFNGKKTGEVKRDYIAVEKLDTKTFLKVFNEIDSYCVSNSFLYCIKNFDNSMDFLVKLGKYIYKNNSVLFNQYADFINLVDAIYKIYGKADLHKDQFGYDKTGKLKCLDI